MYGRSGWCPDSRPRANDHPPWAPQKFSISDLYTSPGANEPIALIPKRIRTRCALMHNVSQTGSKFGVEGLVPDGLINLSFITGSHHRHPPSNASLSRNNELHPCLRTYHDSSNARCASYYLPYNAPYHTLWLHAHCSFLRYRCR